MNNDKDAKKLSHLWDSEDLKTMGEWFNHIFDNNTPNPQPPDTEITQLQDKIEYLNLKLLDAQELNAELSNKISNINEYYSDKSKDHAKLSENYREVSIKASQAENDVLFFKSKIDSLSKELKTSESNRKHASDHIEQCDSLLKVAKNVINELRDKISKYELNNIDKTNAEHLARKAIELQNKNVQLTTDNTTLTDENNKFKEQTTRLINELSQYACSGSKNQATSQMCGGCLECQFKQAQHSLNEQDIVIKNLKEEIYQYKLKQYNNEITKNLVNRNSELLTKLEPFICLKDGPFNSRNDCECINCKYEKTKLILNEKNLSIKETQETIKKLSNVVNIYKNIIHILQSGIVDITVANIFLRKNIAKYTFEEYTLYKKAYDFVDTDLSIEGPSTFTVNLPPVLKV